MDPVASRAIALGLAVLFVAAALHKARGFGDFTAVLGEYRLLPPHAVAVAAAALLCAELVLATCLTVPLWQKQGALGAAFVLLVYSLAIGINLARGRREIDCGCGAGARPLSSALLVRNGLLVAAALMAALPVEPRSATWLDHFTIGCAVGTAALAWVAVGHLADSSPQLAARRTFE